MEKTDQAAGFAAGCVPIRLFEVDPKGWIYADVPFLCSRFGLTEPSVAARQ